MKAEFRRTKTADGLPLTFGKMYDVLDVKAGRRAYQLKEIKVKNDLGQERWYSANKFKLFVEASAFLKEPAAAGAGQDAAQSATPDGSQIIKELTRLRQTEAPIKPIEISLPIEMGGLKEIMKKTRKSMRKMQRSM